MAESASIESNDRDGAIRKTRCIREISVEGFETCSLQRYALELVLRKGFASCGIVRAVSVIKSVAYVRIEGEDAEEKALALNGTDVGGWCAIVKAAPLQWEPSLDRSERIEEGRFNVKGYDTGLPTIDIQIALCKHFSSCGEVMKVTVLAKGLSYINIEGERCLHKALKLSGRDVGGMNLVVDFDVWGRENVKKRPYRAYRPTGYMPSQPPLLEKLEEEMEKEMEKEVEKEEKERKDRIKRIKMEVMAEVMEEEMEMMKVMEVMEMEKKAL